MLTLKLSPISSRLHVSSNDVFLFDWRVVLEAVLVKLVTAEAADRVHGVQGRCFSLPGWVSFMQ